MSEDSVIYSIEDDIAVITINRPNYLNALNHDVLKGIIESLEVIARDKNVRAVIFTGEGEKAFVAGADIATMSKLGPGGLREYLELGQATMRSIETFHLPVIAAVNGYALGGGLELALSCDIIIASDTAQVGQPEVNLGIIPGFGGLERLALRTGIGTAKRLIFSGEIIKADEALRLHLIDQMVDHAVVLMAAKELAKKIASKGPLAVQAAKRVMRENIETDLLSGLRRETESFISLFKSKDREEGMNAFLQKRSPLFEGK